MDYRNQFIKQLREPDQLELFDDPMWDAIRKVIIGILENEDKIRQMHEAMEKALAGEPGSAYRALKTKLREELLSFPRANMWTGPASGAGA